MHRVAVIAVTIFIVITPTQSYNTSQMGEDLILVRDQIDLSPSDYTTYNLTCQNQGGYFGSFQCNRGEVKLSIVETSLIDEFFGGRYTPEYEWQNESLPRWEFPCVDTDNYTFAFTSVSNISARIQLIIAEDLTPIDVNIDYVRVALYLPKYEITFTLTGGFFSHAWVSLPAARQNKYLDDNESLVWNAFYFNTSRSEYVVLPDGPYDVSITTHETMGRTNNLILEIRKTTDQETSVLVGLLSLVTFLSISMEWFRRQRINRSSSTS